MKNNKRSVYGLTLEDWEDFVVGNGQPKFRAAQVFDWLHVKRVASLTEMVNVPKALRELIERKFDFTSFEVVKRQESPDGTMKFLFRLADGNLIETVLMKYSYGYSICVTTQIGCRIGCQFCASSIGGLIRDLDAGEIVAQVIYVGRDIGERIGNVVVMGIGEPFENYDELTKFIYIVNHDKGLNIGARHITVSTSGIIPKIYDFAEDHRQVGLAISLHAPNDRLRSRIMKINRAYPLADLMKAAKAYVKTTNRRVTFEYGMMKDVNDTDECAYQLVRLVKGLNCHINLIPINYVEEYGIARSPKKRVEEFEEILKNQNINVTIRRELGANIDAACGQLRAGESE